MSGDEFDLLISRWLAGELSADEEAALAERLKSGEEARLRFVELADQEAALRILSQSLVQARQIRENEESAGDAGSDTTRRIRMLSRRRWRRGSEAPWRASWIAAAGAAVVFIALALGLASSPKHPASNPKRAPGADLADVPTDPRPAPLPSPRVDRAKDWRDRLDQRDRERDKIRPSAPPPPPAEPQPEAPERPALEERPAPEPAPPVKPNDPTRVLAATIAASEGEVNVVSSTGPVRAHKGAPVLPGQGVETVGAGSAASLLYPDGTRIDLHGDSALEGVLDREPATPGKAAKGKRLRLARGSLLAVVAKQPLDQQMIFVAPHAEAKVLGTTLRILVGPDSTRLEVNEGRVRLTSASTGRAVEVAAGHFAVAATGVELAARPLPIDEILLLPPLGSSKIYGAEWHRVKDAKTVTGWALDVPYRLSAAECEARFNKKSLGHVEFAFQADAGRDYHAWIRGSCMVEAPKVEDRWGWDMVAIAVPNAKCETELPWCLNNTAYGYTGWAYRSGYWWIGGNADRKGDGVEPDEFPITFRFDRPGRQVLRMYVYEAPLRVDAIWLSTTQKTRPDSASRGPSVLKK